MRLNGYLERKASVGFEAAGAQGAVTNLIAGVKKGGTVIIVGVFEENPIVNMGFSESLSLMYWEV